MNKLFCFLVALACAALPLGATPSSLERDGTWVYDPVLKELLVPKHPKLNRETIALGNPIYAAEAGVLAYSNPWKACVHEAKYLQSFIETRWGYYSEPSNPEKNEEIVFTQSVFFNDDTHSESSTWTVEEVGGTQYVVHYHDGFKVYSTVDTQFVISSR